MNWYLFITNLFFIYVFVQQHKNDCNDHNTGKKIKKQKTTNKKKKEQLTSAQSTQTLIFLFWGLMVERCDVKIVLGIDCIRVKGFGTAITVLRPPAEHTLS